MTFSGFFPPGLSFSTIFLNEIVQNLSQKFSKDFYKTLVLTIARLFNLKQEIS